jgi:hypothetical protein
LTREESPRFVSREQARDLVALSERARRGLNAFADQEAGFGVGAVQLLDEWIEDTLKHTPDPPVGACLLWTSLLGDMFRRHHEGWWALQGGELVIVCPTSEGRQYVIQVQGEVERRIAFGMSESLTYFYNITRIELKLG